jgi:hypothetical protein
MSKDNGASAGPVFDFSIISRFWGKAWNTLSKEATELQVAAMEAEGPPEDIEDEKARRKAMVKFGKSQSEILTRLEKIGADQEKLIAMVLDSVPREWLASDAPDEIDWRDPASLDWLLENKFPALVQALNEERQANLKN